MLGLCQSEGIAVIPWSRWPAAASPVLARRNHQRVETDFFGNKMYSQTEEADRKVVDALGQLSEQRGIPRAQIALAWLFSKSVVTAPSSAPASRTTWTTPLPLLM